MLTKKQIRFLLERLAEETVVAPTLAFPYRILERRSGYSNDKEISAIQAALSIMLEMAP